MVNDSHINELDVRIFNFTIRTPVDQVMVFFTLNSQMGERLAHRGRPTEVCGPHAAEVSGPHPVEVSRPHPVEVSRPHPVEVSRPHPVEVSRPHHVEVSIPHPVEVRSARLG